MWFHLLNSSIFAIHVPSGERFFPCDIDAFEAQLRELVVVRCFAGSGSHFCARGESRKESSIGRFEGVYRKGKVRQEEKKGRP